MEETRQSGILGIPIADRREPILVFAQHAKWKIQVMEKPPTPRSAGNDQPPRPFSAGFGRNFDTLSVDSPIDHGGFMSQRRRFFFRP